VGISSSVVWAFAKGTLDDPVTDIFVRKYIGLISRPHILVENLDSYEKVLIVDGNWRAT